MATTSAPFLALLRGVNVGGQNVISKADLIRCFEDLGFTSVRTYIQSGNVLFRAAEMRVGELTRAIETRLSERLGQSVQAVVIPRARYRAAVRAAPSAWGREDDRKHNALFTLPGMTPRRAVAQLPVLEPDIESLAVEGAPDPDHVDEAGCVPRLPAGHREEPPDGLPAAGAPQRGGRVAPIIPACTRRTTRCWPI